MSVTMSIPSDSYNELMRGNIPFIAQQTLEIAASKGWENPRPEHWEDEHFVPANLALIHSEVGEATEAWRLNDKENYAEELADVALRLFINAYGMGIDLVGAIEKKMIKNRHRPHKHGGKRL